MISINGETILNTINSGVILLNEDLNILAWNRWLETLTNIKESEIVGKNIIESFPYINEKKLKRKVKSVLVTNTPSYYSMGSNTYLIDIPINSITNDTYSSMQQEITISPYDIEKKQVSIYIDDSTTICEVNSKLERLNKELEDMSHRDPMTHLFNRRYFAVQSEKIKSFCKRNDLPLSIITLDIDKFKNINDTYGHLAGDDVIIATARVLEKEVRRSDVVARFGGEEFVILLQDCSVESACIVAEKVRRSIEETTVNSADHNINFTISLGVTQFDYEQDKDNIDTTLGRADNALYRAKEAGRNRIVSL